MSWPKLILLNIILLIIGFAGVVWGTDYMRERQVIEDEKRRLDLYSKILDGASTGPSRMTIDYSKQISTGSPLIFGGSHMPYRLHLDAWDKIQEVGVTSVRADLGMNRAILGITLEDYKNNVNDIQNTDKWNNSNIIDIKNRFSEAKKRGLKVIGIMSYTPPWLAYDNTEFGVPSDWEVYEDLIKKTYIIYRNYIDYIEIWNEPNYVRFLNLKNSGMSREEAYSKIFYHATKAIREADIELNDGKKIPIGGPVGYEPKDTSLLEAILRNIDTRDVINFVSYHNYEHLPEPSWVYYKETMKKYDKNNLPIYITEWNASLVEKDKAKYFTTDSAINFTSIKFLEYLKMGIKIANYHSLDPLNENSLNAGNENIGFYYWSNNHAKLLPQARAWRILSKQMKLGKGESRIFEAQLESRSKNQELREGESALMGLVNQVLEPEKTNSIGFKNIDGEYGVALVNSSDQSFVLDTTLEKTSLKSFTKVRVYYASAGNDAKTPVYEGELKADKNGTIRFPFYIPRETVVGMVFVEDKAWYEKIFN